MVTPKKSAPIVLGLRATDQESSRVVAIHQNSGQIVGSGCLVNNHNILTCRHVVEAALGRHSDLQSVYVSLVGLTEQRTIQAKVTKVGSGRLAGDIAHLELVENSSVSLNIPPMQFVSPFRHAGKRYSVLGFPGGEKQGRNAAGNLHAADAIGLVQMDGGSSLFVRGGFSGAPVWSPDVNGFVGMVVTEQEQLGVSWCIPSRILCSFFPQLPVRFRIPLVDRPEIHDYHNDDPNLELFGKVPSKDRYRLTAKIKKNGRGFKVKLKYECLKGAPIGHWVTFITHPTFKQEGEDAYELFAEIKNGVAEEEIEPRDLFTIAAIGDAGETALTLDLDEQWKMTLKRRK